MSLKYEPIPFVLNQVLAHNFGITLAEVNKLWREISATLIRTGARHSTSSFLHQCVRVHIEYSITTATYVRPHHTRHSTWLAMRMPQLHPMPAERCPPRQESRVERLKAKMEPLLT